MRSKTLRIQESKLYGLRACANGFQSTVNSFLDLLDYLDTTGITNVHGFDRKATINITHTDSSTIYTSYAKERIYELCHKLRYTKETTDDYKHATISSNVYTQMRKASIDLGTKISNVPMFLDVLSLTLDIQPYEKTRRASKTRINCKTKVSGASGHHIEQLLNAYLNEYPNTNKKVQHTNKKVQHPVTSKQVRVDSRLEFELSILQLTRLNPMWCYSTRSTQTEFLLDVCYIEYDDNHNSEQLHTEPLNAMQVAIDETMLEQLTTYWHEVEETL